MNKKEMTKEIVTPKTKDNNNIWRIVKDGVTIDYEISDATDEQLKEWYSHALSMVYSRGEKKGRNFIRERVEETRRDATAEMFARYLEMEKGWDRRQCFDDIRGVIERNSSHLTKEEMETLMVSDIMSGVPGKYEDISVERLLKATTYSLSMFDATLVSRSFVISLGICLTKEEMETFLEKDGEGKTRNRMDIIKEKEHLPDKFKLKHKDDGLTYEEMHMMLHLSKMRYEKMTTKCLECLIGKVLPRLILRLDSQIREWEGRAKRLREVMDERGIEYTLEYNEDSVVSTKHEEGQDT